MNKLSEQEIDKELMDRDERKLVRKIIDDKVLPGAAMAVGGAAAAVSGIAGLQTTHKLRDVN